MGFVGFDQPICDFSAFHLKGHLNHFFKALLKFLKGVRIKHLFYLIPIGGITF